MELLEINVMDIYIDDAFNSRKEIRSIELVELAKSIDRQAKKTGGHGLIQPLSVCPMPEFKENPENKKYFLLSGFRRFNAMTKYCNPQRTVVPCVLVESVKTEEEARIFNLEENIERKNLNFAEEAKAIKFFIDNGKTEKYICNRLGKKRGWVQCRAMLCKLPEPIIEEAAAGVVNTNNVRDIYAAYKRDKTGMAAFEVVKKIKNAKREGRVLTNLKLKKDRSEDKRHRKRGEINRLLDHVMDKAPAHLGTVYLAWAAGNISTGEMHARLKEKFPDYVAPEDIKNA